jgi:hypothetical protein
LMLNALLFRVAPCDRLLEPTLEKSIRRVVRRVIVPASAALEAPLVGP